MIHFYHVTKKFDRYSTALYDVTFHIEKGEFVFLTGASGAGKSTLLKLILRQMVPTEGQVAVNGAEPTGNRDPDLTTEIVQIFAEANLRGSTVLLATHDRELIRSSGRRVITLDHGRLAEEKISVPEKPVARSESLFVNWS